MSDADAIDRTADRKAENPVPETLGGRIALARQQAGISAGQLARRLGIETKTMHKWERDQIAPRINKLMTLAGICGVPTNWLLDGGEGGPSGDPMDTEIANLRGQLFSALQMVDSLSQTLRHVSDRLEAIESQRAADC